MACLVYFSPVLVHAHRGCGRGGGGEVHISWLRSWTPRQSSPPDLQDHTRLSDEALVSHTNTTAASYHYRLTAVGLVYSGSICASFSKPQFTKKMLAGSFPGPVL